MTDTPVRDAATVILVRDRNTNPRVLMGQRGATAAFMPSKFVFPGGALDDADRQARLAAPPDAQTLDRLRKEADPALAEPLLLAAIRELWEETGLAFGQSDPRAGDAESRNAFHPDWHAFLDTGTLPSARGLEYIFRAVTPPGRTRRFDARFFVADASGVVGDLDDFSHAEDELSRLHWASLDEMRRLDLPFITEVVLAELQALLATGGAPESVPYVYHRDGRSYFDRL